MPRLPVVSAALAIVLIAACSEATSPPSGNNPVVGDTLLAGEPTAPAIEAIVDKAPTPAADAEITGDLVRSRLSAVVNPSATVGQINDALLANGARISSSTGGIPFVVLSIPPVADEAAARALAAALVSTGAFLLANPAYVSPVKQVRVIPASGDTGISHLVPSRLPAAWNVKHIVTARARVLVGDWFHQLTPIASVTPLRFLASAPVTPSPGENHGFHVAGILAADHDGTDFTGAFPRSDQIDVDGISLQGFSWQERSLAMLDQFPATGTFVLSTSLGYPSGPTNDTLAFTYVQDALHWRMLVASEVGRFLHLTAASNEGDLPGVPGQAFSSSPYNLARFQGDLGSYVAGLDVPAAQKAGFAAIWGWLQTAAPLATQASPNLLSVGSSSRTGVESGFSSRGSDVRAVGEDVYGPCVVVDPDLATYPTTDCNGTRARYSGTSMATPLVAGIAAYLWALEPSLTPVQLKDILQKAYNSAQVGGVLDAYFAVQLLDQSVTDGVMRRALLDVATPTAEGPDGTFDEHDVNAFRAAFRDYADSRDVLGDDYYRDYGRWDLNGDGFTGDSIRGDTARVGFFDLDADGVLASATRTIEGVERTFDELLASDLDILCYYVYSVLYQGDPDERAVVAPDCSVDCDDPVPVLGRSSHAGQCPTTLPGVPPSIIDVEESGWYFSVLGSPACVEDQITISQAPPLALSRTGTCTFPNGSATGSVGVTEDDRGRGASRGQMSGRLQSAADTITIARARMSAYARHYLVVTDPSRYDTPGTMRARVAVDLRMSIPAYNDDCPGPIANGVAYVQFNISGNSVIQETRQLSRTRGCVGGAATPTASGVLTDTLEIPIDFNFGLPITVVIGHGGLSNVTGRHAQNIDGSFEASYDFIGFLDLPVGAVVQVASGRQWGIPPVPAGSVAWRVPERPR